MLTLSESADTSDTVGDSGVERRRGLRVRQHRPIKVFESTASRYFGGQTQDVSTTGLRLELPASMAIRPGKLLSIHVGLSESGQALANRRQMIPARVVWVDRSADQNCKTISAGIEFMASISAQLDAA